MRIDADSLNLSAEQQQAVATRLVEREFDARGAGIEDGNATLCSGHGSILSGNDVDAAVDIDGATGDAMSEGRGEVGARPTDVHDVDQLAERRLVRRLVQQVLEILEPGGGA